MDTATPSKPPRYFRRIVWSLALSETLIWAATFYAFAALLPAWEQEVAWTKTQLSAAFTLALFLSAVLAPLIGRQIDRSRAKIVLRLGPVLAALGLLLLASAQDTSRFYLSWAILGVAMAGSLYDPCFAYLTRIFGPERRRAIMLVTLAAGLAGTVSFLGFYWLTEWLDWRAAVRIAALVALVIVAPLNIIATQFGDHLPLPADPERNIKPAGAPQFWRTPLFWLLSLGIAAMSLNHAVLMTHIRPLLSDRGLQAGVVVGLAAAVGPMHVAGRLVLLILERRISTYSLVLVSLLMAIAAAGLLLFTSGQVILAALFVVLQGAGHGMTAILRPVLTADVMGRANFGLIAGTISFLSQGALAAAPTIAALVWGGFGYNRVIGVAIAAAGLAMLCFGIVRRVTDRS